MGELSRGVPSKVVGGLETTTVPTSFGCITGGTRWRNYESATITLLMGAGRSLRLGVSPLFNLLCIAEQQAVGSFPTEGERQSTESLPSTASIYFGPVHLRPDYQNAAGASDGRCNTFICDSR